MNRKTAEKLLDALERVDHGGFGGTSGLTAKGKDLVALHDLAMRVRAGLLSEAKTFLADESWGSEEHRFEEVISWLSSSLEIASLLAPAEEMRP